jgi:hypothetical protein
MGIKKFRRLKVQGTTGNISVAGMLRLLCSYGKTGVFEIDGEKIKGRIELNAGEITDAVIFAGTDKKLGARASVIKLLTVLEEGSFSYEEKTSEKKESAGFCAEDLIMESARALYDGKKNLPGLKDYLPPENEVLKIAKLSKNKKINLSFFSEEWNMLTAFNGDVNSGVVLDKAGPEREKAAVILYGLVSAGFLRRSRFKIPEVSKIARDTMGNIGSAIVDNSFLKLKIDKARMGMKDFLMLLNELENSFAEIAGRTRAKEIIEKIWAASK